MSLINVKSIHETRTTFPTVFAEALKSREIICRNAKSTNEEKISILSTEVLEEILSKYKFCPVVNYDNETNMYEIKLDEIAQFAYAETKQEAEENLLDLVEDYTCDYIERADIFRKFDDYKGHYPYILRIAHCSNREEIRRIVFNGDM
jgi:antitoxin YefM